MPSQTANNVQIGYKVQSGLGVPASGAGATGLRVKPSQSMTLTKAIIPSEEVRRDGQRTRGRHGSRSAGAAYTSELSVGSFDELFQAVLRGTWTASAAITQVAMTSITTTTATIVAAAGSWLTQGVRVGDLVQLTGHSTAANNAKWFRVLAVTASTITVPAASLVTDAVADTSFTLTVAKTVINGATPVERYFTVEEYLQDIDGSLLGTDMKVSKLDINIQPNANIEVGFTFMGRDMQPLASGSAPSFTPTPTYSVTLPLVMVDGIIRILGVDYAVLTGFQFSLDLGGSVPPTLSSTSPDIFLGNAALSGSFSAIQGDLVFLTAYSAETPVEFFVLCAENEADPKDFVSFFIGNATLSGNSSGIAAEGPRAEQIPWAAGKDETGGDRASTMLKIATSAA